jgi:hypothetical protein
MKDMKRIILLCLACALPAQAQSPDPAAVAREAALRAGVSSPRQPVSAQAGPARAGEDVTEDGFMALRRSPARDFPVTAPRKAVEALLAAEPATPPASDMATDPDAAATAAGLQAIRDFRNSRGLR